MKTLRIALSFVLVGQIACQNNKFSDFMGSSKNTGIVGDHPVRIENPLQPNTEDQALKAYEASMLNSYADSETRKVYNELLAKATNPMEAIYNPQLSDMAQYAHNFYQMTDAYPRPELDEVAQISGIYKNEMDKIQKDFGIQRQALEDIDLVGTGLSAYAGATGVGLIPAVTFELTKSTFVYVAEKKIDSLESAAKDQAATLVVDAIGKMSMQQMSDLAKIDMGSPEQAKRMAQDMMKDLTSRLIPSDLSQEDKTALQAALGKKIGEETYAILLEHKSVQNIINYRQAHINEYVDARITQTEKNIVGLTRSVNEFRKETSEKFNTLFNNQEKIMGFIQEQGREISNLTRSAAETEIRTKFLADYMFGKMSAGEQVQALQSGVYGDPNSKAVKDLLAQKERIYQREKFQAEVNNLIADVQNIAIIASRLGVDPKIVNTLSKGAQYADAAMKTATAMMTGNYIGAALAVTGVFGGGGDNNAEVMNFLKQMDVKLDKIIELQKQTIEMIGKVSEQIQHNTIMLANQIYSVQYMQLVANEALEALLNRDRNSCQVIKMVIQREYGASQADFLLNLTLSNRQALTTCAESLEHSFYANAMATKYHWATYLTVKDIQRPEAQDDFYWSLRQYVVDKKEGAQKIYASLLDPVQNYLSLKKKIDNPGLKDASVDASILYDRRIHPMAVVDDANFLLALLPSLVIYQNQKVSNDLFSAVSPQLGFHQYQMLISATNWINKAIVQESLLSGDALLEEIYKEREKLDTAVTCGTGIQDDNRTNPYCLLKMSPMLRTNYLMYSIRKDLDQKGIMASSFLTAMNTHHKGEDSTFERLLGRKLPLEYDDAGKPKAFLLVGEKIDISLMQKIAKGQLVYSPALPHLLELRNSLISKISEMRMNMVLTENQRRYLTYKVFGQ